MKLYRKKLDSVEALKREKIRLRYERRHTKASDLNPLAKAGRSKVTAVAKEGLMGTVMELFSAKNNLQLALALAKPLFNTMRKRRASKRALYEEWNAVQYKGKKRKPYFLKKLVQEIAVGYATGKAVLMTVRGIQLILRRRKFAKMKSKLGIS